MEKQKRVSFITLGCKLNFSETSDIANQFEKAGYLWVEEHEPVDVFVINTCTVTEIANKKSKQAIRKAIKNNPKALVVAMGCYTQLKPNEVAGIEGVDLILGSDNKTKIIEEIEQLSLVDKPVIRINSLIERAPFTPTYSFGDRTRSFLKVQDGCDYFCSYCAIPNARGRSRSNSIQITTEKAREVVKKGVKEIILAGVNIGDFGKNSGENLLGLIKELEQIQGLERLRISSIEPNLLTHEIIHWISHSKVIVPHFHIPLQCGTNKLLKTMKRRYTTDFYQSKIEQIKRLMPHACIAADVIVGVPGETDEDFKQTIDFLEQIDVSYLHVFTYSERENTLAINMPLQVPIALRKERSKIMHQLALKKQQIFHKHNEGTIRPVLFEGTELNGFAGGFTDNYIRVEIPFNESLSNTIKAVKLLKINNNGTMIGELTD